MSSLSDLPADRQAVLSLLVKQRRTYEQVAGMLKIESAAVRTRALDAVAALGGEAPTGISDAEREQIADYLLGQLSESERIETLALLLDTAPGRAWARRVADALAPIAGDGMPAVPDDPDGPITEKRAPEARAATPATADAGAETAATTTEPGGASSEGAEPREGAGRGTNRALGVLVAAAALIVAAIVVFIVNSGSSSTLPTGPIPASAATATASSSSTTAAGTGATGSSTTAAGTGATGSSSVSHELVLRPTAAGGSAAGAVAILTSSSTPELAFTAQKLSAAPAGEHYVLWLYDSPTHFQALGEVASIKNGTVSPVAVPLPSTASSYHGVVLTLEPSSRPAKPGTIVLQGTSSSPL